MTLKISEWLKKYKKHKDIHSLRNLLTILENSDNGRFVQKLLKGKDKNQRGLEEYNNFVEIPEGREIVDEYLFEKELGEKTLDRWLKEHKTKLNRK